MWSVGRSKLSDTFHRIRRFAAGLCEVNRPNIDSIILVMTTVPSMSLVPFDNDTRTVI